ncbi:MAG: DUF2017 domain-containing protein [Propionibacteriales bacterium]|nr:DUF2017 domain-containing protein [Propionibacteriales bacterium]
MTQFKARRKGGVYVVLPPYAAELIANLARQLIELLSDGEVAQPSGVDPLEAMLDFDAPREAPDDPALLRLLPSAHRDDEEAAAEFRRFTERALREGKVRDARVVLSKLADVGDGIPDDLEFELDAQQARAWMRCLNDLRLTLAARLGVEADDEAKWEALPEGDERLPVYEIYGWLGYVLESLIDVVRH